MLTARRLAIALSVVLVACGPSQPRFTAANPFAEPSTLFDQAPPFDRIHNADFQPAIEEGMRRQLAEVAAVAADTAAPTFGNTIVALERSGMLLQRAASVFNALTSANTNDTLQQVQEVVAPKLAAHRDAIFLNDTLFQRVKSVYDRRATLGLDTLQQFLVERYYRDFVRAGALLPDSDKARLRTLNQEEASSTACAGGRAPPPPRRRRTATSPASGCSRCGTRRSSRRRPRSATGRCGSASTGRPRLGPSAATATTPAS
jgi:peptidyl-dipeptidase Dcp